MRSSRGDRLGGGSGKSYKTLKRVFSFEQGKYISRIKINPPNYNWEKYFLYPIHRVLKYSSSAYTLFSTDNSNNATAYMYSSHRNSIRLIGMNSNFLNSTIAPASFGGKATETGLEIIRQIIAHEVGHHIAFHSSKNYNSYASGIIAELEADYISGQIMAALDSSLIGTFWYFYKYVGSTRSKTHPARCERLRAVWLGDRKSVV